MTPQTTGSMPLHNTQDDREDRNSCSASGINTPASSTGPEWQPTCESKLSVRYEIVSNGASSESTATFLYMPDPTNTYDPKNWVATLTVICNDIPGLMRNGVEWNGDDIVHEEGHVKSQYCYDDPINMKAFDLSVNHTYKFLLGGETYYKVPKGVVVDTRFWYLGRSRGSVSWVARIEVACLRPNVSLLTTFNPAKLLTKDRVHYVKSPGNGGVTQYTWTFAAPHFNTNCI
ncbi:hypothetical protein QBC44DRAFT_302628 [Cladorrhinum sp. PSN332]|nr:hypothetical protein QBC44DRAFT_302628 [Cladorrhinum sp. PSN332]